METINTPITLRTRLTSRATGTPLLSPTIELGDVIATLADGTQVNVPLAQISVDAAGFVSITLTAAQNDTLGYLSVALVDVAGSEWLGSYSDPVEVVGVAASQDIVSEVAASILGTSDTPTPDNSPLLKQLERTDGQLDKAFKDGDRIRVLIVDAAGEPVLDASGSQQIRIADNTKVN